MPEFKIESIESYSPHNRAKLLLVSSPSLSHIESLPLGSPYLKSSLNSIPNDTEPKKLDFKLQKVKYFSICFAFFTLLKVFKQIKWTTFQQDRRAATSKLTLQQYSPSRRRRTSTWISMQFFCFIDQRDNKQYPSYEDSPPSLTEDLWFTRLSHRLLRIITSFIIKLFLNSYYFFILLLLFLQ